MDVLFSLPDDAGLVNTDRALDFIENVVAGFKLGPSQMQVGITPRNCPLGSAIKLHEHDDKRAFG